ncbi:hypothetical protein EDD16DRAFT_1539270 [Pisolithus croceorrhizus]|nr:hypothetical protein EDD16DRAFT_1539270 [Pisolithus croceorrhizus]
MHPIALLVPLLHHTAAGAVRPAIGPVVFSAISHGVIASRQSHAHYTLMHPSFDVKYRIHATQFPQGQVCEGAESTNPRSVCPLLSR